MLLCAGSGVWQGPTIHDGHDPTRLAIPYPLDSDYLPLARAGEAEHAFGGRSAARRRFLIDVNYFCRLATTILAGRSQVEHG